LYFTGEVDRDVNSARNILKIAIEKLKGEGKPLLHSLTLFSSFSLPQEEIEMKLKKELL